MSNSTPNWIGQGEMLIYIWSSWDLELQFRSSIWSSKEQGRGGAKGLNEELWKDGGERKEERGP